MAPWIWLSFGLQCPLMSEFNPDTSKCPTMNNVMESEAVWIWESPHPYSFLTCCVETLKCPVASHQIHMQIKSFFGIKTSSNPNQCEVKGIQP